ncbi:MAG: 3-hydroxyacyl-CoA dehydrogenase/enoyl-CoA hydratase family protein [Myxococcales bacterium]|nr:3-hydroxyacyl-CoA dehydrogenase/enoyl-CoA hydratase family protein [Myxococcales bacterium]MCB9734407.1 3-hydroxyacyl-CoA dehydrogenase/enoyl-CoA hydratase family protein [Deltaproteobacteria bacterium]
MGTGIRKAAVLGAGVMGSGIAAHLASCGIRTILLDIVPPNLKPEEQSDRDARNRFAAGGVANALKSKPNVFLDKSAASLIEVGNLEDDLGRLKEVDWIIEVVKEDMAVKRKLLTNVEANWTPGTIVTTNTSGLSIDGMLEGRSADFKRHFFGTHFFNPVRYMHLLEVIPGTDTDPAHIDTMVGFVRRILGKGVVFAKDTPNFIANRIGVYAMMKTIGSMMELGYTIEEVDAIVGRPMGRPKSAAFGTADVVGLDTFVHVSQNCWDSLPNDPERAVFAIPDFLTQMVKNGMLGRKSGAGFYKKEGKTILTLDPATLSFRAPQEPDMPVLKKVKKIEDAGDRVKALVADDSRAGKFAWHVLSHSLAYAANIAFDIADDIVNIDRAMRWGFNWELGPFETWQALGVKETAERMRKDGIALPAWIDDAIAAGGFYATDDGTPKYFARGKGQTAVQAIPGSLSLAQLKSAGKVVEKNRGATLIDLGDGIAGLEFHTKMNTVDGDVTEMLHKACEIVERDFDGLVLANEGEHFSAGANLMLIVMQANQKKWDAIEGVVEQFQGAVQRLKYLNKPVVSNPHGLTLGGGCEMAMAADRMVVAQETYMGLVEVGVGLIPGGAGTLNLLKRVFQHVPNTRPQNFDPLPLIQRAFENIGMAKVATGAGEVFDLGYGTPMDEIAINRDTRIADAKRLARYLADRGYAPPKPARNLFLPGKDGWAAISLFIYGMMLSGFASEHDKLIADKLGNVLCGGDTDGRTAVSEERVIELEREAFMSLVGEPKTIERMQYMLMNNKPLRN